MHSSRLAALVLGAAVFAGCSRPVDVHAPNVRGIGYVRVDDVVKKHPLYGQLSDIDSAIDAINMESLAPSVPKTGAALTAATKELNAELVAAQNHANAILHQKQLDYAQREQAAIRAALTAAGEGGAGLQSGNAMQQQAQQQAQQVTQSANRDFLAYQQSVIAQSRTALAQIEAQINARAERELRQKQTDMQERESQLQLDISQRDSAQRLNLRTKLSGLALDDATRKQYRDQLDALDRSEASAITAARSRDEAELAAFSKQLRQQTSSEVTAQAAKLNAQTQTKIAARRSEVATQVNSTIRGLAVQTGPANASPEVRAKIAQIDKQFRDAFNADAKKTLDDYQVTKADLDARYQQLQGVDVGATGTAKRQLDDLHKQRQELYDKMVKQIQDDATQLAAKRGLNIVLVNVSAAAGGYDLTDEVTKDIESLHE